MGVPAPGVYLVPGGVCSWGVPGLGGCLLLGCTWSWGVLGVYLVLGGVCSWGGVPGLGRGSAPGGMYLVPGGVPGPRGRLLLGGVPGLEGVFAPGGCLLLRGVPGQVLPPVDRHTPVNILPCPKLRLRAVERES